MTQAELSKQFAQLVAASESKPQEAMVLRDRIETGGPVVAKFCRDLLQGEAQNLPSTVECIRLLSSFQQPQDAPLIGSFLGSPELRIRTAAIVALLGHYEVSRKDLSEKIKEAAQREKDLAAKVLLAKLIGKTKDREAAPMLDTLLSSTPEAERQKITIYGALEHACMQSRQALGH